LASVCPAGGQSDDGEGRRVGERGDGQKVQFNVEDDGMMPLTRAKANVAAHSAAVPSDERLESPRQSDRIVAHHITARRGPDDPRRPAGCGHRNSSGKRNTAVNRITRPVAPIARNAAAGA